MPTSESSVSARSAACLRLIFSCARIAVTSKSVSSRTDEGDRFGLGVAAGYAYMLGKHFNLDFGVGLWSGYDLYTRYSCPSCGVTEASGGRFFVLPDDILIAVTYVF